MQLFKLFYCLSVCLFVSFSLFAQPENRWQQRIEYKMDIDVDVDNHTYKGFQTIVYHNNSPESLDRVFFHLYFNAFQPGSMMDTWSRQLPDPDPRVKDRIFYLKEDQQGYQNIKSLKQDGKELNFEVAETILEVELDAPIPPGGKTTFEMDWDAQIPIQVRRSGRNNMEGIEYSMSQWYPKMCNYDYRGWHANPYVAREFYGIFGDFDVTIRIDKDYLVGAGGVLQNADAIGKGYASKAERTNNSKGEKLSWHFKAENIHDFVWAADPDFIHETIQVPNGPIVRFIYQPGEKTANWKKCKEDVVKTFQFISKNYGEYPYPEYSIIQGGDRGMEYPMATLITGNRGYASLMGVIIHEVLHSWVPMILGVNESLYAWMDEGFSNYAGNLVKQYLFDLKENPHYGAYSGYLYGIKLGIEEPLSTHADHYKNNSAYNAAAYSKGVVYFNQLSYVVGQSNFQKGWLEFYEKWKFKHPNPDDLIRVMENVSGLELDWYNEYFLNTTKHIDYAIKKVEEVGSKSTSVVIDKLGQMPMPIDLVVDYADGTQELFHIPLGIMRGEKQQEFESIKHTVVKDWYWTSPNYNLIIPSKIRKIEKISIDPSMRMADVNRDNNNVIIKK